MSYLKRHGTRRVPQSAPLPGQAPNSAGGFAWAVDDWTRLRRFLVLGSEGGSYYASERTLTRENAQAVERCVREDGLRAVAEIVARVDARAARRRTIRRCTRSRWRPASGDVETRRAALDGAAAGGPHGHAPVPVRRCSSRASAAGAARCVARSAAGTRRSRSTRSRTRR